MKLLSIIMPVYDSENYLSDCLNSVIVQTYTQGYYKKYAKYDKYYNRKVQWKIFMIIHTFGLYETYIHFKLK